jgi:hypothetical protein
MTKEELIEKLTLEIPSLKTSDPRKVGEAIDSLVTDLLQLKALESQEQYDFWHGKSIEQLAREQGVRPLEKLEDIWGKGADLWKDEEDFQSFLLATKGIDPQGTKS